MVAVESSVTLREGEGEGEREMYQLGSGCSCEIPHLVVFCFQVGDILMTLITVSKPRVHVYNRFDSVTQYPLCQRYKPNLLFPMVTVSCCGS